MIVDSSALVAIVKGENDAETFVDTLGRGAVAVSTATLLECVLVLGPQRLALLDDLVARGRLEIVPFDTKQLAAARQAHLTYGRGRGSRARLNFGDCISYALAKTRGEPLLFKGDDFTHTDVESAL